MMLQASHFLVIRRNTGKVVGHAVTCPAARYASTKFLHVERMLRGFANVDDWKIIEQDLERGWETGRVPADALVTRTLLVGELRGECALQWLGTGTVKDIDGSAADGLDAFVRAQEAR